MYRNEHQVEHVRRVINLPHYFLLKFYKGAARKKNETVCVSNKIIWRHVILLLIISNLYKGEQNTSRQKRKIKKVILESQYIIYI